LVLVMQPLLKSGWLLSPFPLHILLSQVVFKNPSRAEGPEQGLSPMATRHLSVVALPGPFRTHRAGLFILRSGQARCRRGLMPPGPGDPGSTPVTDDGILALPLASGYPADSQPLAELLLRVSVSLRLECTTWLPLTLWSSQRRPSLKAQAPTLRADSGHHRSVTRKGGV